METFRGEDKSLSGVLFCMYRYEEVVEEEVLEGTKEDGWDDMFGRMMVSTTFKIVALFTAQHVLWVNNHSTIGTIQHSSSPPRRAPSSGL